MTPELIKAKHARLFSLLPDKYCTWEMFLIVKQSETKELDKLKITNLSKNLNPNIHFF